MPMTHIPEICTKSPYQKMGAVNRHENTACPICYRKLIPEKFGTNLHVRLPETGTSFLVGLPGFGTDFW